MPNNEENKIINENIESKELNQNPTEIAAIREQSLSLEATENNEAASSSSTKRSSTKIQKNTRMTAQALAATAVIGIASLVIISTSGLINISMDGAINEIVYQDNGVRYNITVDNVNKDNDLFFEVYSDNKVVATYNIDFEHKNSFAGDLEGYISISDLNIEERLNTIDKLTYDFHLCGDTGLVNRTYDSWTLEVSKFESEFNGVNYQCDCSNSGCFLFTFDFVDDYNIFTDFEATLTDSQANTRKCIFTDNLHQQQKIPVFDFAGGECEFVVTYMKNDELVKLSYNVEI